MDDKLYELIANELAGDEKSDPRCPNLFHYCYRQYSLFNNYQPIKTFDKLKSILEFLTFSGEYEKIKMDVNLCKNIEHVINVPSHTINFPFGSKYGEAYIIFQQQSNNLFPDPRNARSLNRLIVNREFFETPLRILPALLNMPVHRYTIKSVSQPPQPICLTLEVER